MQITDVSRSNAAAVSQAADATVKKTAEEPSAVETISRKKDEYVSAEKEEPIGLYKKTVDDSGNSVIEFDKASDKAAETADIAAESAGNNSSAEDKPTAETEKKPEGGIKKPAAGVNGSGGEIKTLKEKAKQLKKQISSAEEQDANRLRAKLKALESEISRKSSKA